MPEWQPAQLVAAHDETATARSLVFDIPGWPGHLAGQHVDVRVTAPDGYTASREYSIASGEVDAAPSGLGASGVNVELSVEELDDGEVSPYLVRGLDIGDHLEIRGPVGGYFVWTAAQTEPVQLIAGGSGVVPLMSMLRTHAAAGHPSPMRLLYSVRGPQFAFYTDELRRLVDSSKGSLTVDYAFTREAPSGADRSIGRLMRDELEMLTVPVASSPTTYLCGPNSFVEGISGWLVELGHPASRILTERFGGA
ncbi:oxidoreductase [Subtercola boreus]|uniref:Oxidoreductase n=1 Tax=Subtercola boreus TaxID=120213 RepID=A0A3E0VE68_9MICO|nr:ferredoxin reductase [Subtercola boreus]RFA08031.1 oxidoreductase [Subtercola boreus]